jgi:hypothetical protein
MYSRYQLEGLFMLKWALCHHSMVYPQTADEGNNIHIWRVAENTVY